MAHSNLDPAAQAALAAYVDALYDGASEFIALYTAVTAWLSHSPSSAVEEARRSIAALVGGPPPQNVIPFRPPA